MNKACVRQEDGSCEGCNQGRDCPLPMDTSGFWYHFIGFISITILMVCGVTVLARVL